jgi:multicomponent Na+:H+ antiporter subunit A
MSGTLTVLLAAWMAIGQKDLKKILAYTTLAALGTLTVLLGLGTPKAFEAFLAFITAHALYKACFFMLAGTVDHQTGTRDINELGALRHAMPICATVAVLAGLAFAGLPPTMSFMGKELALEAALNSPNLLLGAFALTGLVLSAIVFVFLTTLLVWGVFFAKPATGGDLPKTPREASWGFWIGPLILAILGLVHGIAPSGLVHAIFEPASEGFFGQRASYHFALWHGLGAPLFITFAVVAIGAALYRPRRRILSTAEKIIAGTRWTPEALYHWKIGLIPGVSKRVFDSIQNGSLRFYIGVVLSFTVVFALWPLTHGFELNISQHMWNDLRPEEALIHIALIGGAITTLLSRKTFVALASAGIIGLSVAFYYVIYGAPDLAITQVLVEALSLILVIFVLFYFSRVAIPLSRLSQWSAAAIASGMGCVFAVALLLTLGNRHFESISWYFSENSLALAHGRNIVNVILVDFRAWDTLGEIVVLGIASVGVYVMVRWRKGDRDA